jgi:two-component system, NarL family, sensor histidine kinase DevS
MRDSDQDRMRRLVGDGRALLAELDPDVVLERVLRTAQEVTGARYAALGILDATRTQLERFVSRGLDERTRRAIGELPRGRGVLGILIEEPRPLRLSDVSRHPQSYGVPHGHPVMHSFLGVPIMIRGEAWGNLYLTDKQDGEFDETDEEAAVILADWAAIAIENARLYRTSEERRTELEKALRGLQAAQDIAIAIGGDVGVERVLELIVKRGRALVEARSLVILLREGRELMVAASAGHAVDVQGVRLSIVGSTSGEVLERLRPERIADVGARLRISPRELGVPDARSALLVPLVYRGEPLGVLTAFDRGEGGDAFTEDDEQVLRTFAASAAKAVAMAQSVEGDRLRHSLAAADAERRRWARELHDETLQGLGGLRVLLASTLRRGDARQTKQAMREAIGHIEREIANLRTIITDLRPAALDELGLRPAIEALIDRHAREGDFEISGRLELPDVASSDLRLPTELETTIYRVVQEALRNATKHARARHVRVVVAQTAAELRVEILDDGVGFAADADSPGFGLAGMRERVHLAGGALAIESGERGTLVRARLPTHRQWKGAAARRTPQSSSRPRRRA